MKLAICYSGILKSRIQNKLIEQPQWAWHHRCPHCSSWALICVLLLRLPSLSVCPSPVSRLTFRVIFFSWLNYIVNPCPRRGLNYPVPEFSIQRLVSTLVLYTSELMRKRTGSQPVPGLPRLCGRFPAICSHALVYLWIAGCLFTSLHRDGHFSRDVLGSKPPRSSFRAWRDNSAVKIQYFSCRGPFGS